VGGVPYFCVKDFIRRTAAERMGPMDALQYWIRLSLALQHEHDITQSFVYKFPGPCEQPNVCINASGLQILLHHMEKEFNMVNQAYREQVFTRLQEVVDGDGEKYIEDYDDGEVDEQLLMMGEDHGDCRFRYRQLVTVTGEEVQMDVALRMLSHQNEELQAAVALQEKTMENMKRNSEMLMGALKKRIAELEQEAVDKHLKDDSFSLSMLVEEIGLEVPPDRLKLLCRRVADLFKRQFPTTVLGKRRHVVFFHPDDRGAVENLVRQVHLEMDLEAMEKDHWVNRDVVEV
jgi:hypothetical protein